MSASISKSLSDLIRSDFLPLDRSVDDLLTHPDDAKEFAHSVIAATGSEIDVPSVLRELIRLRKIGERRGGLPRRVRAFNGRGADRCGSSDD